MYMYQLLEAGECLISMYIRIFFFTLGIKRQVVDMLLSYNPLWLRIGLEVGKFSHFEIVISIGQLCLYMFTQILALYFSDNIWRNSSHSF